jgi:AmmeMemoRadiSam system protein A
VTVGQCAPLDDGDRAALLALAVRTVASGLRRRPLRRTEVTVDRPALQALGATFVTLERGRSLLGCVGTLEAVRPLGEDVMQNAYRSAFHDPRLPRVTVDDFAVMSVKVSVLSPLTPIPSESREALVAALRPGIDGLLIVVEGRRATFLPSVWPKVADPDEFVDLLLDKAGLPSRRWPPAVEAMRYTTDEFADPGPRRF